MMTEDRLLPHESGELELPPSWARLTLTDPGWFVPVGVPSFSNRKPYFSTGSIQETGRLPDGEFGFSDRPARANRLGQEWDVLQARMSGSNKPVLVVGPLSGVLFSTGFMQWRPPVSPETLGPWLFYAVQAPEFLSQRDRLASGTTQVALNDGNLAKITIPIAPIAEQRRIVEAIETRFTRLNAAIRALERARANLKRFRASALWSAFGSPSVVSGTRTVHLSEIADIQGGITLGKKRDPSEHTRLVPYLRVANVQRGFVDLSEVKSIEATEEEIRRLRLQPGDVLFNEGGDRDKLGRGWVWEGQISECIHQNHVFRARIRNGMALPRFVSHYGNSVAQKFFWDQGKHTTNMASINRTSLGSLPISIPDIDIQRALLLDIERRLSIADRVAAEIEFGFKRCGRLRESILSSAFGGRLVPQDPNDEPASALLERIKMDHAASSKPRRRARGILAAP